VVLQMTLLRRLPPEKFHRVLSAVQLAFMVGFVVATQMLVPAIVQLEAVSRTSMWWYWIPGTWFASLPALAAGADVRAQIVPLVLGAGALTTLAAIGVRSLAPRYTTDVEAARIAGHDAPVVPSRWSRFDARLASLLGGAPLRRAGFEFLLAQFEGDRRMRMQLFAFLGVPIGMVVAGLLGTRGFDPYGNAPPVPLPGAFAEWGSTRGLTLLYTAAYMLAFFLASTSRSLCETPSWRAGWVFYAAPVARYDRFYAGLIAGLAYRVMLPALLLHALLLLIVWRAPVHVAAHLALPAGVAV
jgi:hypothetical protein